MEPYLEGVAVQCRDLVKTYSGGLTAVNGLDLVIARGECFGLLGPNGAGKTTTIEILEGLLRPTSGTVEVLGRTWGKDDRELRMRLGVTLQETVLSEKLTVLETLTLFRSFYERGLGPEQAVALVELSEKARARIGKLSGGQKQRLAVACALIGDPEILFLDEPTTGLDPQSRRHLWEILRRLRSEGRTILVTTHYMDEAERLCDRVAVVDRGKVIAQGSPAELIASLGADHVIEISLGGLTGEVVSPAESALRDLTGVSEVRRENGVLSLTVEQPHVVLPAILARVAALNATVTGLRMRHATLEDVFVKLTGRHLRDAEPAAA